MPTLIRLRVVSMFLPGLLCLTAGALAQEPSQPTLQPRQPSLQARQTSPPPRTISLNVVVTSSNGEPVSGLQQKDFTLLDDKKPQAITSFQPYSGNKEPVEMILLVDALNTGFSIVAQERIQIDRFLRSNEGKLTYPTTLAVLGNTGVQMQGAYTVDGNRLASSLDTFNIALRTLGLSSGSQGEAERLQASLNALRLLATYESSRPGRKIVLWVSPGWPLLSGPRVDISFKQQQAIFDEITWLSANLRESQTTIDSINPMGVGESPLETLLYQEYLKGVRQPKEDSFGDLSLQVIATNTAGLVLSSTDVSGLLKRCVSDAAAYYTLAFEPPIADRRDVYHSLQIEIGQPGLIARTSSGYYAQP